MELRPILSAMRRNKVGAILIAVQMAVTLAILCNGLFIIEQRVASSQRPTGVDEANLFVLINLWVGNPTDLAARLQADLAALRSVPGVIDAFATNSYPLSDGGSTDGVSLHPDQKDAMTLSALYFTDEHGLQTLGLKLIAGRNFNSDEIVDKVGFTDFKPPCTSRPKNIKRRSSASSISCKCLGFKREAGEANSTTIRCSSRSGTSTSTLFIWCARNPGSCRRSCRRRRGSSSRSTARASRKFSR